MTSFVTLFGKQIEIQSVSNRWWPDSTVIAAVNRTTKWMQNTIRSFLDKKGKKKNGHKHAHAPKEARMKVTENYLAVFSVAILHIHSHPYPSHSPWETLAVVCIQSSKIYIERRRVAASSLKPLWIDLPYLSRSNVYVHQPCGESTFVKISKIKQMISLWQRMYNVMSAWDT